jgi:hypothetical protein
MLQLDIYFMRIGNTILEKKLRKRFYSEEEIEQLEKSLQVSLNPVNPNPEFVTDLHRRLYAAPIIVMEARRAEKAYLVVAMGLFLGVLLVWLIKFMNDRGTKREENPA